MKWTSSTALTQVSQVSNIKLTEWMDMRADAAVMYNEIVLSLAVDCFGIKLAFELDYFVDFYMDCNLQHLWIVCSMAGLLNCRFDETIRMQLTSFVLIKTTQLFLNITDWIWADDEFALLMKNATTRFENACLFAFCFKRHSRPHFHLFFNFLAIDFLVTVRKTYPVVLARWK